MSAEQISHRLVCRVDLREVGSWHVSHTATEDSDREEKLQGWWRNKQDGRPETISPIPGVLVQIIHTIRGQHSSLHVDTKRAHLYLMSARVVLGFPRKRLFTLFDCVSLVWMRWSRSRSNRRDSLIFQLCRCGGRRRSTISSHIDHNTHATGVKRMIQNKDHLTYHCLVSKWVANWTATGVERERLFCAICHKRVFGLRSDSIYQGCLSSWIPALLSKQRISVEENNNY